MIQRLIGIIISFSVFGCHPKKPCYHSEVPIKNNSTSTIYIISWFGYLSIDSNNYKGKENPLNNNSKYAARPGELNKYLSYNIIQTCPSDLLSDNDTNHKLLIWIFDSSTIATFSWDSVRNKGLYIRKYVLNYRDLDNLGWIINYP